jgi:ferredoxin
MARSRRKIVRIDEEKCDGCGLCANACQEGAIRIVDGKARLVSESYCDGLGACLGDCPRGAITIEEREAEEFDEHAVEEMKRRSAPPSACGCPSAAARTLRPGDDSAAGQGPMPSRLANWPVQLHLVPVSAPYLEGADLLIAADCTAFAHGDFHRRFVRGRVVIIACPKLDDTGPYVEKLAAILRTRDIRSVEVVYMQVPCCSGLVRLVSDAREAAGVDIPLRLTRIGLDGAILESGTA